MKQILLIILIMIVWVNVQAQNYKGYTGCCEQDSMALVAFYNATDGADWYSNQDGFSSDDLGDDVATYYSTTYPNAGMKPWFDGPVKDWFGVTLEKQLAENGTDTVWRVIHLHPTVDRRSNGDDNLSGYVPQEVGMLTALQWFKVNGNTGLKNSELPDEIYHPDMVEFDVESAYFSGIVSDAIKQCTQLQFLNLRYNYFDSIPTIDFVDEDVFNEYFTVSGKVFFYENQISWAALESTAKYFGENGGYYEARLQDNVGRYREIIVEEGDTVTLTCPDAGSEEYATYSWLKGSRYKYKYESTYTINGVTPSDTGSYYVVTMNDLVYDNDGSQKGYEDADTYTKAIHVTFTPSTPTFSKAISTQDGKSVVLYFSKPMKTPVDSQKDEFTVICGGETKTIESISRTGRLFDRISLNMEGSLLKGEEVSVSYTKGSVVCSNGGEVESFSSAVENRTSVKPHLVSAETRTDGMGIVLTFDYFIDPEKLDATAFTLSGSDSNSIASISLVDGTVDDDISKQILLVVSNELSSADELTVSYNEEALFGLYGSPVDAISNFSVTNSVEDDRISVFFTVIDGTQKLDSLAIFGDLSTNYIGLYDDGSNGDETACDHTWSKKVRLSDGDYAWDAYSIVPSYITSTKDTTIAGVNYSYEVTDTLYTNTILSDDYIFSVSVADGKVTGDTIFGYRNNSITLILDLENFLSGDTSVTADPYVMGIDDDWTEGLAMSATSNEYQYSLILDQLAYDEEVDYSYRNGEYWENTNLLLRSAIVESDTTITNEFGDFYNRTDDAPESSIVYINSNDESEDSGIEESNNCICVYPNPVTNYLNVNGMDEDMSVRIYDITGTLKLSFSGGSNTIDVSELPKGLYIVRLYSQKSPVYTTQIIKY